MDFCHRTEFHLLKEFVCFIAFDLCKTCVFCVQMPVDSVLDGFGAEFRFALKCRLALVLDVNCIHFGQSDFEALAIVAERRTEISDIWKSIRYHTDWVYTYRIVRSDS